LLYFPASFNSMLLHFPCLPHRMNSIHFDLSWGSSLFISPPRGQQILRVLARLLCLPINSLLCSSHVLVPLECFWIIHSFELWSSILVTQAPSFTAGPRFANSLCMMDTSHCRFGAQPFRVSCAILDDSPSHLTVSYLYLFFGLTSLWARFSHVSPRSNSEFLSDHVSFSSFSARD